jgi:hypothetical protein
LEYTVSLSTKAFENFIKGLCSELEWMSEDGRECNGWEDLIQFLLDSKIFQYFPKEKHKRIFFQGVVNAVNKDMVRDFNLKLKI